MSAWTRMSREKKRAWGLVGGAIIAGTVLKVGFFKVSRGRIVDDAERNHTEGMERLREAREFAQRSRQEHEQNLPQLTDEQDRQLRKYLRLIEDHGWNKSIEMASRQQQQQLQENGMSSSSSADCVGCPVLNYVKNRDNNNEVTK